MDNFKISSCNDHDILIWIKSRKQLMETRAYNCIKYNCGDKLLGKLYKANVGVEVQQEFFSEALEDLFHNIISNKYRGESNICTYLISIARNKWLTNLKRKNTLQDYLHSIKEKDTSTYNDEEWIISYLNKKLGKEEKEVFEERLKNDIALTEMLEIIKNNNQKVVLVSDISELENTLKQEDPDYLKWEVEPKLIQLYNHVDRQVSEAALLLHCYYWEFECDFEKMAQAEMRPNENYQRVYDRVRKRVLRAKEKITPYMKKMLT